MRRGRAAVPCSVHVDVLEGLERRPSCSVSVFLGILDQQDVVEICPKP